MLLTRRATSDRRPCGDKARWLAFLSLSSLLTVACGSRSTLRPGDEDPLADATGGTAGAGGMPVTSCTQDDECLDFVDLCAIRDCIAGSCVETARLDCDDGDECTTDSCNPVARTCVHEPRTEDLDGDGFRAPLPGFRAGEAGSCGLDCDDTSDLSHPRGVERCDGVDNDCDGVIDNGAQYLNGELSTPVSLAEGMASQAARLAFGDGTFAVGYSTPIDGRARGHLRGFDALGRATFEPRATANVNVITFGPDVTWSGDAFGVAWADTRADGNYETYFARFDTAGEKLAPDLRLSNTDDFSIDPVVAYDRGQYLVAWSERLSSSIMDESVITGRLLDASGETASNAVSLTSTGMVADVPSVAPGVDGWGLSFIAIDSGVTYVAAATFDRDLEPTAPVQFLVQQNVVNPRIVRVQDDFVVTWATREPGPGPSIWGALISQEGEVLRAAAPITDGDVYARDQMTLSLGDRFILMWSGGDANGVNLRAAVLDRDFSIVEEPVVLLEGDELDIAGVALSDSGTLGLVYDERTGLETEAFFSFLRCSTP